MQIYFVLPWITLEGCAAGAAALMLFILAPVAYLSWVIVGFNHEQAKLGFPPLEF